LLQVVGTTTEPDTAISRRHHSSGKQQASSKPRRFLTRRDQAERYGKSVRTIERWGLDEKMNMPAEYDFNGVKARLEEELEHWERGRVA
jgi:hypothetical protein